MSVDAVYHYVALRYLQTYRRIAEQGIVQLVYRSVGAVADDSVLCHSLSLADTVELAVCLGEQRLHVFGIEILVLRDIHRACRSVEGESATVRIKHRVHSDVAHRSVVRHDVA